jgi:hypothetical protein
MALMPLLPENVSFTSRVTSVAQPVRPPPTLEALPEMELRMMSEPAGAQV